MFFFRKSIRTWPENGRGNMLCDEKNGGQSPLNTQKKSRKNIQIPFFPKPRLTELKIHSFWKVPPGIPKQRKKQFFFQKNWPFNNFFSISLCPSNQKVINWKNFGFIKTFPLVFFYYTNFSPFFEIRLN